MNKIGLVGIKGLVGQAILDSLELLDLEESDNNTFYYYGTAHEIHDEYVIEQFDLSVLNDLDYAILAVGNTLVKDIYNYVNKNNLPIKIIDNSSEYRLYKNVPLCIPEINANTIGDSKFISNPNCVTTLMCMVLKPLMSLANIKRIVASTYQAASGAGYKGLKELERQTYEMGTRYGAPECGYMCYHQEEKLTTDFWGKQYALNIFSHNSPITDTLYNEEEMKLINETKKILDINCKITATCIRVPTLRSHCISLNVEFDDELNKDDIIKQLESFDGVQILDNVEENKFPEPITTSDKTDVYVGRIRPDIDDMKCWNFFISGDQLLKGAGYNSVQILKYLLEK